MFLDIIIIIFIQEFGTLLHKIRHETIKNKAQHLTQIITELNHIESSSIKFHNHISSNNTCSTK